ncbi:YggS family pyridoxal phosphate-dependent enzyme [Leptolyngbya sp. PCC 6406]|uniref:YggS family pyridoxal phosphate-dependent enzyme n=1 Tax=Leptolyngbya sp. PCC 6406 TaxID=1173264 RepID=UPI0002AC771A|nr:YggS family pyridoxal phosphate-dependent enzyme [Leptolyngbya sp. PCC 6406]
MTVSLSPESIAQRIATIQAQLPATTRLIAVTKTQPATVVRAAYDAGVRDFGESRLQEAMEKQAQLQDLADITWHLIGHLQTNKIRKALQHFHWIHSLDSLKLARKLDQAAAEMGVSPHCCLQVKMVPDPPKSGFSLADLTAALPELNHFTHIKIVGLMTLPPQGSTVEATRDIFTAARDLAESINQQRDGQRPAQRGHSIQIRDLSMGMSGDYAIAIAAGATMIRLGSTLFGERPPQG